jgi:dihydroorotase
MNGGMKDMANVVSKFLAMGMSIQDAILRSTWNPAQAINRNELGSLTEGSDADVAIFNLMPGDFGYLDVRGIRFPGKQKLVAELTIRGGKVVWDLNGLAALKYDPKLPN